MAMLSLDVSRAYIYAPANERLFVDIVDEAKQKGMENCC